MTNTPAGSAQPPTVPRWIPLLIGILIVSAIVVGVWLMFGEHGLMTPRRPGI